MTNDKPSAEQEAAEWAHDVTAGTEKLVDFAVVKQAHLAGQSVGYQRALEGLKDPKLIDFYKLHHRILILEGEVLEAERRGKERALEEVLSIAHGESYPSSEYSTNNVVLLDDLEKAITNLKAKGGV